MSEAWFRFKNKFMMVPNHRMLGRNFLLIFYHALNTSSKYVKNTIIGESFISLRWEATLKMLERSIIPN